MAELNKFYHSVTLDKEKCKGCTNCIKRCPTEAIRVRNGKAVIMPERCIDCGECIKMCPHHAKEAVFDRFKEFEGKFRWKVALPAPTLYGQFNNLDDIDYVLTGLLEYGFDDVFEVSRGAEVVSDYTRKLMAEGGLKKPVISSACPAVIRLIRVRFPKLCDHVLPVVAPYIVAARIARKQAVEKTGFKPEEIGIFFLSPCPAKVTDAKVPLGVSSSGIDGVLAISDVYKKLVSKMNKLERTEALSHSGIVGISWATSGGEASALLREKHLAADGIENVINVLEELEDDKLSDLDFIELNACTGGCVGGVLTMENPFIVRTRIQRLRKYLPVSMNKASQELQDSGWLSWEKGLEYAPIMQLDADVPTAMRKMLKIEELIKKLPGLDCGSCGAPSCRALAEDVIKGTAKENDCLFVLREKIGRLFAEMSDVDTFDKSL